MILMMYTEEYMHSRFFQILLIIKNSNYIYLQIKIFRPIFFKLYVSKACTCK